MNGGVISSMGFLSAGVAATVTFVAFPHLYGWTWPWVASFSVGGYSLGLQDWAPWMWSALLIWLLYAGTRTLILLVASLGGILAVLGMIFGRRRR